MAKLKISQKQYNSIILHEEMERLNTHSSTINEITTPNTDLIKESFKDVVLGIATILGVKLTGRNEIVGNEAIKNESIMAEIKATLEDENKLGELVDALTAKGMKNPETRLSVSPETLVYDYNKTAKENGIKSTVGIKAALALNTLKK
jgi:hypothetical protein